MNNALGGGGGGYGGGGGGYGGGGGGLIRKRSLSGSGGPGQGHPTATLLNQTMMSGGGAMHGNNNNSSGYASDASRTLETVLNIILTLCEGTLTAVATTQQQQQQQQILSPFSRQNSGINPAASLGLLPRVNSWTMSRGDRDTPNSPLNQSRHDTVSLGPGLGSGSGSGLGSGLGSESVATHQHNLSLPLLIDSAAVLCSFALRSLAEVPQVRQPACNQLTPQQHTLATHPSNTP